MENEFPFPPNQTPPQLQHLSNILERLNQKYSDQPNLLDQQKDSLVKSISAIQKLMMLDLQAIPTDASTTSSNSVLLLVQIDYLQKLQSVMLSMQTQYLATLSSICRVPWESSEKPKTVM